jgi:Ca-activated chloride channel family protein
MVLIVIALARPQTSDTLVKKNVDGIDIIIALDVSDSMTIEDMKPNNRLEAAKDIIANFMDKRESDRIGMVIFAGESFTLVPLTLDYDLLKSRVNEITTARKARIKDGTAIGVALANAAGRLKESTAKNRVIIFLTDGENNSGTIDPSTALDIAKGYGLKIYSIGIGKDGPTRIPVPGVDLFGNPVKTYQPFESYVNDELLGRMASETSGKYYRATDEKALTEVFNDIDRLEKTKIDVNRFTKYTELFPRFLMLAILFAMSGMFLSATVLRRAP